MTHPTHLIILDLILYIKVVKCLKSLFEAKRVVTMDKDSRVQMTGKCVMIKDGIYKVFSDN
jgi:hypothetical protein